MVFIETATFTRSAEKLLDEDDLDALQSLLLLDPPPAMAHQLRQLIE